MSAFVCSKTHIATCAQAIHKELEGHESLPNEIDIRMMLAKENVASVAWRYGPEGHAAYAPLLGAILGELSEKGWDADRLVAAGLKDKSINEACFVEGYTVAQFLMDCRTASPQPHTAAEAFMYLSCLSYQSCEHPEWEQSEACRLIEQTERSMGLDQKTVNEQLKGRHVWECMDPEPAKDLGHEGEYGPK